MAKPGPKPGRNAYTARAEDYATTYQSEYRRCGKAGCRCAAGDLHGPYWYAYRYDPARRRRIPTYLGRQGPTPEQLAAAAGQPGSFPGDVEVNEETSNC